VESKEEAVGDGGVDGEVLLQDQLYQPEHLFYVFLGVVLDVGHFIEGEEEETAQYQFLDCESELFVVLQLSNNGVFQSFNALPQHGEYRSEVFVEH